MIDTTITGQQLDNITDEDWEALLTTLSPEGKQEEHLIQCLTFSPDTKILAYGEKDGTLSFRSVPDGTLLQQFLRYDRDSSFFFRQRVVFSPDGQMVASTNHETYRLFVWLVGLERLPLNQITQEQQQWCQHRLQQEDELTRTEACWLELLTTLLRWRQHCDAGQESKSASTFQAPLTQKELFHALKTGKNEYITSRGLEVVEPLLAACQNSNREIAEPARAVLKHLQQPEVQEAVWHKLITLNPPWVPEILLQLPYIPPQPECQALKYFLLQQWDRYDTLDFDHSLLKTVYHQAAQPVRRHIAEIAKAAGRIEWIEVALDERRMFMQDSLEHADWSTFLKTLIRTRRWDLLWKSVSAIPIKRLPQVFQHLKTSGWMPPADHEQAQLCDLMTLALKCP